MSVKYLLASAAFAAGLACAAVASADTIIGSETDGGGFVGNFIEATFPGTSYLVASDGEASFDPFGAGYDTSDGINFSDVGFVWDQAPDSHWTEIGHQTWVLPADLTAFGCGVENATTCEPAGHFVSPSAWNPAILGKYWILDSAGLKSDLIIASNTAAGADLLFFSDPSFPVPEASTWALMLVGFGGLGAVLRHRRSVAVAA